MKPTWGERVDFILQANGRGKEESGLSYRPPSIVEGIQSCNPRRTGPDTRTTEDHYFLACVQAHQPQDSTEYSRLGALTSINNQESAPTQMPTRERSDRGSSSIAGPALKISHHSGLKQVV